VTVVGVVGDSLDGITAEARRALATASWVAGSRRSLDSWRTWLGRGAAKEAGARAVPTIEADNEISVFADQVARRAVDRMEDVCVLAAGDPGFFGVVGSLLRVMERSRLRILPGPSSVALAFARVGLPWDDAVVVSLEERPLDEAVRVLRLSRKAAVLTSASRPPQMLGRALLESGLSADLVAVCSRLGCADEQVREPDLAELASGSWDPLSVVVFVGPGGLQGVGWGEAGPEERAPRWHPSAGWPGAQVAVAPATPDAPDAERRAVALSKLAPPQSGVLWDLGDVDGGVAVDCARHCPGLTVFAVTDSDDEAARVTARAAPFGVAVHAVSGGREALELLPDPDRVALHNAGADVLDVVLRRLRPGGRVVATYTAIDWAAWAADRLGSMVQLGAAHAQRTADGGWQLVAQDPVFVVWGESDLVHSD
jgi:precorrin-6Y C5,15-methyltransferase (decarboxylating)